MRRLKSGKGKKVPSVVVQRIVLIIADKVKPQRWRADILERVFLICGYCFLLFSPAPGLQESEAFVLLSVDSALAFL